MFDEWYRAYPKKVARSVAVKSWDRMSEDERNSAIAALPKHCAKWAHDGTEKQFMPNPATWLNQKRWEDEVEIEVKPTNNWRHSESGTSDMARKVGIYPAPGEDWETLRKRIVARLVRAA